MKKVLSTIIICCIAYIVFPQSQRTVLVEEFTSGTCPPSGYQDPVLDTLLAHNTGKVVSIMYQGPPWPSPDPMYNQNPSDVNDRSAFYSVPYVPYGRVDGQSPGLTSPNVVHITQTYLDTAYSKPSPFTILTSSAFNASGDSMIIDITINCTQDVIITQPKLYVAIVENIVHFAAPIPGSTLKNFYTVMRKMTPSANGTSLTGSWTNGQSQSFQFACAVNPVLYDFSQLAVVSFIQDVASKDVYQAGYAPANIQQYDAGILSVMPISASCSNVYNASAVLKNYGTDTLTSCNIYYSADGASPQLYNWTGSLAQNSVDTIMFPPQSVSNSVSHTLNIYTSNPNSNPDYCYFNNSNTSYFLMATSATGITTVTQDFQGPTFPPADWSIQNNSNDATWNRATGAGGFSMSSACVRLPFYDIPAGSPADYFYLPVTDLSSALAPLYFSFDIAYRQYSTEHDSLNVQVSVDCGSTWNTLYAKSGSTLATAPSSTTVFVPNGSQWRKDSVLLNSYAGQSNVLIRFEGISRYGNNLFIDNIKFDATGTVGIQGHPGQNNLAIFPNPTNGQFTVSGEQEIELINIYNLTGKLVYSSSSPEVTLDQSSGVYSVQIIDKNKNLTIKKLIIQ
jgi:hypothetical protein